MCQPCLILFHFPSARPVLVDVRELHTQAELLFTLKWTLTQIF